MFFMMCAYILHNNSHDVSAVKKKNPSKALKLLLDENYFQKLNVKMENLSRRLWCDYGNMQF